MNTEMRREIEVKPESHCKWELAKDFWARAKPWGFRKCGKIQCRNKGGNEHGNLSGPRKSLQVMTISCGSWSPTKSAPSSFTSQLTQVTGEITGHTTGFTLSFFVFLLHLWGPWRTLAPYCPQRGHPVHSISCVPSSSHEEGLMVMDMSPFPLPTWDLWKLTPGKCFQVLTTPPSPWEFI